MISKINLPLSLKLLRRFDFPRKLGILEKLYGANLSRHGRCWVSCSNGVEWKLDLTDPCHRWIVFGKYEGGAGIELAQNYLKDGGVFVDSGANIGQWLLYLGHIRNLKALEFEPVTSERNWLTECLSHQDNWNADVFEFGLSSKDAEVEIQLDGSRSTLNMDWYKDSNNERERVLLKRLDETLERLDIDQVDFWKLDTEGAEKQALLGAQSYLENRKIKCIYFECHPLNYQEIRVYLQSLNYQIFDLRGAELLPKTVERIESTQDLVAIPAD